LDRQPKTGVFSRDILEAKGKMSSKINLNTAPESELQRLMGVGPVVAKNIIELRLLGPITRENLRNVSGLKITEAFLEDASFDHEQDELDSDNELLSLVDESKVLDTDRGGLEMAAGGEEPKKVDPTEELRAKEQSQIDNLARLSDTRNLSNQAKAFDAKVGYHDTGARFKVKAEHPATHTVDPMFDFMVGLLESQRESNRLTAETSTALINFLGTKRVIAVGRRMIGLGYLSRTHALFRYRKLYHLMGHKIGVLLSKSS
jgi:hypothetical protein